MSERRLEELLPFAANGTLTPEEQAELDAALAEDARLAEELRFVEALRDEVRGREVPSSPGEFGLARLKRAVAAEAPVARRTNWWKAGAVAACALFAVQTGFVLTASDDRVELAGGGPLDEGPVFTVAFSPEATEAEIRALLLDAGVEIIAGPSALGLYRLAPVAGVDAAAADAALRAAGNIVEDLNLE